jgi:hypothetical protein
VLLQSTFVFDRDRAVPPVDQVELNAGLIAALFHHSL